jgi:hypothetical protein
VAILSVSAAPATYEAERRLIPQLDRIEGAPTQYRLEPLEIEGEEGPVLGYVYRLATEGCRLRQENRWVN